MAIRPFFVATALVVMLANVAHPARAADSVAVLQGLMRNGEHARALDMTVRVKPDFAAAHENLGDLYARLAAQSYGRTRQLDTANHSAEAKLARLREAGLAPAAAKP